MATDDEECQGKSLLHFEDGILMYVGKMCVQPAFPVQRRQITARSTKNFVISIA